MEKIIDSNVAFIFPGQGSQHIGMGKDIFDNFGEARLVMEESSDILGIDMKKLILGDDEGLLNLTENTQPALLTVSIAILKVMQKEYNINPVCVSGHSLGEYSANVFAGSLDFPHALLITRKRGILMQNACPPGFGKMAAIIGINEDAVVSLIKEINGQDKHDNVFAANFNSPIQTVISGKSSSIDRACEIFKERGAKRVVVLPVSAPFHTPFMEDAKVSLKDYFQEDWFSNASYEIFSNASSLNYSKKNDVVKYLLEQIVSPVRWNESVLNMKKLFNISVFVEIGPSNVLGSLIKRIDRKVNSLSVNSIPMLKELGKFSLVSN